MAITIAITGMLATNTAEAAKRKVVIEDHTGAWCGWCPLGMDGLEEFENLYGESVIGVGVHNGDNMTISTYQTPLAQSMGVTGYPSGTINRIAFNGAKAIHPSAWASPLSSTVNSNVPVGVTLDVDYDKTTGAYTATITAVVESPVNADLGFNLWILQDYMTGSGTGWNQSNYLSGNATYSNSKFFDLPSSIPGFLHMDVFRAATAGLEGEQGTFPAGTVPAGTYKQVYTGNVTNMNVTDKNNAFFVAVVHNKTTKEIMNADRVGKVVKPKDRLATSVTDAYISVVNDTKHNGEVTLKNENDWSITADLSIDTDKSIIPAGWGVSLSNSTVTLAGNATRKVQIEVLKNKIEGFAQIVLKVVPQESANVSVTTDATVFFMSENIEDAIIYGFDDGIAPIINAINASGELTKPVLVSGASDIITNFPQMSNFKTAVLTVTDRSIGFSDATTSGQLALIKSLMTKGCDIMIASCFDVINLGGIVNGLQPTAEATDFFTNTLGVSMGSPLQVLNSSNQLVPVPFTGVSGDPISNGLSFNYNTAYNSTTYPFYAVYLATMQLNGKTNAQAILSAATSASPTTLNENNNKVGIRLDNNGQRTVYFSFALDPVPSPGRDQLIKTTLNWLKGAGATAKGPSISLSTTQVVFGEINETKTGTETIQVTNTGDEALVISAINFKTGTNFKVKGSTPLTIDAGQKVNVSVEFTPTEVKNYTDVITIVSNDKANPNSVVTVMGIGISGTASVSGIIPNVFTMTVGPNPVVNNSEIRLEINGSVNLNLELIDATGRVVRTIYNGVSTSNTLDLNAAQLSSGTYYLNANVNGKTTQLPVVVTK